MKYYEVDFRIEPCTEVQQDLLCALLGEVGFETFQNTPEGVKAWIQQSVLERNGIDEVVGNNLFSGSAISYTIDEAPDEDWNSTWEQEGFKPVIISLIPGPSPSVEGSDCICIHDINHTDVPECQYDIVINPCQAFGTGSHETTRMILRQLCQMDLKGRSVIDAGTGTGILSIMCSRLGAAEIYAYDIDEWSVNNTASNLELNNIDNVTTALGDSSVLQGHKADLLIANINRNILLGDLPRFASALNMGGHLLLSGFYRDDVPVLVEKANRLGLVKTHEEHDGDWTSLQFKKKINED